MRPGSEAAGPAPFDLASRSVLSAYDLGRFPEPTLFHRVARAVCAADCLPRKELYESWQVARRVRRRFRGGRVVDLACGHALTASLLLLLDGSSPHALAVDARLPASAARLHGEPEKAFPQLAGRLLLEQGDLEHTELAADDLVVSVHACGTLTDRVIERALAARARVALLPCCHDLKRCDTGGLEGWLEPTLAIDVTRAQRLRQAGFSVLTQRIPAEITPKNRLLLAFPHP